MSRKVRNKAAAWLAMLCVALGTLLPGQTAFARLGGTPDQDSYENYQVYITEPRLVDWGSREHLEPMEGPFEFVVNQTINLAGDVIPFGDLVLGVAERIYKLAIDKERLVRVEPKVFVAIYERRAYIYDEDRGLLGPITFEQRITWGAATLYYVGLDGVPAAKLVQVNKLQDRVSCHYWQDAEIRQMMLHLYGGRGFDYESDQALMEAYEGGTHMAFPNEKWDDLCGARGGYWWGHPHH